MTNPFFGNMPQQKGVAPPAAPSGTTSLTSDIDPIKRAKFTGYLEGMSANAVPPQPPQPPMMPQPMNMGGMVDVFDPMYMNQGGFVISTDKDGKIRTKPVFSEDRGRMVSQILSRDMVDDMANQAAMLKTRQSPPMEVEPESKFVGFADTPVVVDDSLKGVPDFTTTTVEPETATIELPTPKPKIQLPVSKPEFSDIEVPLSKPNQDTINEAIEAFLPKSKPKSILSEDFTDTPNYERFKADYTDIPNYRRGDLEDMIRDIDDLGTEDRSLDPSTAADLILGKGDAVFDTPTLGNLSRNVMARRLIEDESPPISDSMPDRAIGLLDRLYNPGLQATLGVTRDAPEGDFTFSSAVPVEKLENLYEENTLEDVLTRQEEKQGLDLLAMILNALRPQFTTESAGFEEIGGGEDFPPSTALRSSRFNDGGIVQGFRRGGDVYAEKEKYRDKSFSSNISGNVGGRDDRDSDDLGSATPIFKTVGEGRSPVSGNVYDAYTRPPKDFTDLRTIKSTSPLTEGVLPSGSLAQGAPDNMFGLNRITKPIIEMLGYDTSTPAGVGKYYADTARSEAAYLRGQEERKRDQDRAERKLAEEQRLRDMIAGMMPKTAATPAPPMVTAPDAPTADPATPDYSSVVVPSDRVPGFDVGNISPFPQFRMPTEFSPVFPSSLSADYFRDLFKNIGVNKMQEGGAVNQLDSAIDNFINAYR